MSYVLEARSLRKRFKEIEAVKGIDVLVAPGERVGLLGPNGAGKTTTLLMLLGAITPDEGTITIAGRQLPDRLKVREALGVFAGWYGVRDHARAVAETLERFEITHLGERLCSSLSSGQRTLVGIVKATVHQPRLLVLDEPTASLGPDIALKVRRGLIEFCDGTGASLLVTSHDMREVEMLTHRVIFLARGEVVANDSAAAIVAEYGYVDLEAVFLSLAAEHGR
jgi:ABC-2 type transport system ATP-binding protein